MAKGEKAKTPTTATAGDRGTRPGGPTKSDRTQAGSRPAKAPLRERVSRQLMRVGFLRRRYVKRMLRYLDKSKEKGRRLPPEMFELQRYLSQVPKAQRANRLEEAITAQQNGEAVGNRDLRRASANQSRMSGRGSNRYRPGMPPRSMMPGPRPPKRPR